METLLSTINIPLASKQVVVPSRVILTLQAISRKASIAVTLIGCIVICGWIFDITTFKSILPGLVSMKANTAICFILGSLSLWSYHQQHLSRKNQTNKRKIFSINFITYLLPSLVILISLLTLIQYSFNLNLGIDEIFFQDRVNAVSTAAPGRMAPNTALTFLLFGSALLLLHLPRPNYLPAQLFTLGGFLISCLGLLGYVYGNAYFYHFGKSYTAMALHTALAFIVMSLGILFCSPERGLMRAIASNDAGGIMARKLLLPALIFPPLSGWLILLGYRTEIYTSDMGISLLGMLNMIFFSILIWSSAKTMSRIDGQRYQAEIALKEINNQLENRVLERTLQLQQANERLTIEETALRESEERYRQQATELKKLLHELQATQSQLIQTEKMSSLGQLVAGVAHEINNPINFIYGNITHVTQYLEDLLSLVNIYQQYYPAPVAEIQAEIDAIELDFLIEDLPNLLSSMKLGADRIREIVLSLRNFSRLDESVIKSVNLHQGLDSTLLILQHRLKAKSDFPRIELVKEYGNLPEVDCYASQINQVFMNILANAIDALETGKKDWGSDLVPTLWIRTEVIDDDKVAIRIGDNGSGITPEVHQKLFDPFFTTKPVGKGTGLGLSISYQIVVEKHRGKLQVDSTPGKGTEFTIELPIRSAL